MGLNEFLAMGGKGAFVWGAYGVTALLFAFEVMIVRRSGAAARASLASAGDGAREMEPQGLQECP